MSDILQRDVGRISAQIERVDDIAVTLSFTHTLGVWKIIVENMNNAPYHARREEFMCEVMELVEAIEKQVDI